MTVQNTPSEVTFVGTGVQTSFVFTFRVDDIAWLSVDFVTDFDQFLINVDQEATPGGSAEYLVAPPNLQELTVTRTTPKDQLVDYTRYDPFDSESHEFALDKLTMLVQDVCASFDGHILDLDIHFSDAPADGVYYSRRNNAWEEPPFALPTDHFTLLNIGVNTHVQIDNHIADAAIHFGDAPADAQNYARNNNAWVVSPPTVTDHLLLTNIGVNTHAQIDTHIADSTVHFLEASIDHANILNIGSNTHVGIDAHIANGGIHFTVASIDHTAILNIGVNSHAVLDGHLGTLNIHFVDAPADAQDYVRNNNVWVVASAGVTDHFLLTNIGVNTHVQIDSHLADASIHFTEASIDHTAISNIGVNSHAVIDTHLANTAIHFVDAPADSESYVRNNNAWVLESPGGGLLSGQYRFSTSIVAADPGAGRFRYDNAAYASVTEIFIDDFTNPGVDISNILALITTGDRLYIQGEDDSNEFAVWNVTGPSVDNVGWFTIPVELETGGNVLGNNDRTIFVLQIGGTALSQTVQRQWFGSMATDAFVFSDFTDPTVGIQTDGLLAIAAGAGSGLSVPTAGYNFTNHPGVWGLNTGATSAGRVFLLSKFARTMHVGVGGVTRFGAWYQAPAVLSDVANRYVLRAGWSSMALPNTILEGITFEYQDNQNGGRWQGVCEDGIGETSLDTGVAVVASTYYQLEIEVNAAGTSVEFFIDKVSVGTVGANIPSGTGFGLFVSIHIMKIIGLANRASYIDAYYLHQEVTR